MRVLHIFNEINFSGGEVMYSNAAALFQSADIELWALSTGVLMGNYVDVFLANKISVQHMPLPENTRNLIQLYRYSKALTNFLLRNEIDVVHIHRSTFFWLFALSAYRANKKIIRTLHNVFRSRTLTWPKAFLERKISGNIFKVKFQAIGKSVFENELSYYKNRCVTVNNWFNGSKFFPLQNGEHQNELRKKLNLQEDSIVIVTAGRCTPEKRHEDIIEALSILPKGIKCEFLHLGSGKLESTEKELAIRVRIQDRVHFIGNVQNVRDYYVAADIFVMPSKFEGLPIAAIEAMACGKASILYNSPGLRDLIKNEDNGLLIYPSPTDLAEAISKYYKNRDLITTKGSAALSFVNENFSMQLGVSKIIELYNQ